MAYGIKTLPLQSEIFAMIPTKNQIVKLCKKL